MNHLPFTIRQQREQLMSLWNANTVYGAMVKFRDLTEVLLRLPVLCAGAFILAKGGSEREQLTAELVRRGDLDGWDWIRVARKMQGNQHIPNPLLRIIDRVCQWTTSEKVIEWRNTEIAHGALRFNPDRDFLEDFQKKMLSLDRLLDDLQEDFSSIFISEDASTMTYEGETLPIVPYTYSNSGDAYLFSDYKKGLATGLCYALGIRRAMPSEHFVQVAKSMTDRLQATGVSDELLHIEISDLLDELNEAANFEYPNYLRDWLSKSMNGIAKGTLLLKMERGMGKSAFARALDGKSTDSAYDSIKLDDTFTRAYYCSRISIRSKGDFLSGVRNSLLTSEENSLLYSSNEMIPDLSKDSTPKDFAALLNWCKEQIVENHLLLIIDGIDEIPAEYCSILQMLPSADLLDDGIYILLTCRTKDSVCTDTTSKEENSHIETVRSLVHPDRQRAYARNDAHNLETLKSYFNTKIIPKDSKLRKNNRSIEDDIQKLINHPGQMRFLEVRIIGTLLKSGKISDISSFVDHPDLFEYYLDYLRREEYGDIVFQRLTELLAALAIAQEELTLSEIAYILGEDDVSVQLLTFVRDLSGILRLSRDYRGNHVSLASEAYRSRIISDYPETVERHRQSLVDILTYVDIDALKAQAPDKHNPISDGLLYIAAYFPTITDKITDEVLDKVYLDIDDCVKNSMEFNTLRRRAKLGELWSEYCEKASINIYCVDFMSIAGNSLSALTNFGAALAIETNCINLCKKYNNIPNDLARLYMNRGITLSKMSKYKEALNDLTYCIKIRKHLSDNDLSDNKNEFAVSYLNLGNTLGDIGEQSKALRNYNRSIEIMESLAREGNLLSENDLASAYLSRGVTYYEVCRYSNALHDLDKCIEIRERLRVRDKLYDLFSLSVAYMNRGNVLGCVGELSQSLKNLDLSIEIMEILQNEKKLYERDTLAKAYNDRGITFYQLSKYKEALNDLNKCIEIRTKLKSENKMYDLNSYATSYMNRGNILGDLGRQTDALCDYNTCIDLMKSLQFIQKLYDLNDLASAYMNRGITYKNLNQYDKSVIDLNNCINMMIELYHDHMLYDLNDLASAYLNRGVTNKALGYYDDALKDYNKCIRIMEMLRKNHQLWNTNSLASAYMNYGVIQAETGNIDNALFYYNKCIEERETLYNNNSLYDIGDLATIKYNKCVLLNEGFEDREEALNILNQAISILENKETLSFGAQDTLEKLYKYKKVIEDHM